MWSLSKDWYFEHTQLTLLVYIQTMMFKELRAVLRAPRSHVSSQVKSPFTCRGYESAKQEF